VAVETTHTFMRWPPASPAAMSARRACVPLLTFIRTSTPSQSAETEPVASVLDAAPHRPHAWVKGRDVLRSRERHRGEREEGDRKCEFLHFVICIGYRTARRTKSLYSVRDCPAHTVTDGRGHANGDHCTGALRGPRAIHIPDRLGPSEICHAILRGQVAPLAPAAPPRRLYLSGAALRLGTAGIAG